MEYHSYSSLCIVLFGSLILSYLLHCECRKLDGYEFPVYSTELCPRNQTEWNERSSAINCTKDNGYLCFPNEKFTQLLEFCHRSRFIWIEKDLSCTSIGNGCFLAEPSCKEKTIQPQGTTEQMHLENVTRNDVTESSTDENTKQIHTENGSDINGEIVLIPIIAGILLPFFIFCMMCVIHRKEFQIFRRKSDVESHREDERTPLFTGIELNKTVSNEEESRLERGIFEQWQEDNIKFVSTRACKTVEEMIKSRNLVIVAGNSGSGKSAIIQNIALRYRSQGWTVKPIYKINEITDAYSSINPLPQKTLFVFNDPIGKESCDEIAYKLWKEHEERLKACLKDVKLFLSCRKYILNDPRIRGILKDASGIVDISNDQLKLNNDEKRNIWKSHSSNNNLYKDQIDEIVQFDAYFPLLCKLYFSSQNEQKDCLKFFGEPFKGFQNDIKYFSESCKEKYCALVLLFLFNGELCVTDIRENDKFQLALDLCGLIKIAPSAIGNTLETLEGFFVKKIGDTYHFYHDFIMEVTTYVFATDYPQETIKYADIGFLRRRVKLENCNNKCDQLTVYLSDKYIYLLGERLVNEIFGEGLFDVVLNPCLRNNNVIQVFKEILKYHPRKHNLLSQKVELQMANRERLQESDYKLSSKLDLVYLEITPLNALIVYDHTEISLYCLKDLQELLREFKDNSLFSAMCCNGSLDLFAMFTKEDISYFLSTKWIDLHPIHIVSVLHNYEVLHELIKAGVDVNLKTDETNYWTPLTLAAGNDTEENEEFLKENTNQTRRKKTVQLLLSKGALINACNNHGASPLYIACQKGYDDTVQLLLSNGADVNLCKNDGFSPLSTACLNGHESTVQLLLSNGAEVNLCDKNGPSPLYIACQNGHDSTVQLLLSNGADVNLCDNDGFSPLSTACLNGHESTVQLLLSKGAAVNLCDNDGFSPLYVACQNGHESTVQLLLRNGADVNLCKNDGFSPLSIACLNGHESTVQLLLCNGAEVNLCNKKGTSPLYIACQNGHDSTVQLLLSNGAEVNLCDNDGFSPLYVACLNGHDNTVQLLLSNGAVVNLCDKNGPSPLYIACQNGHDSTVQLLLSNGADVNLCDNDGFSPLYVACQNGHESTVQLLLRNGADVNLCKNDGFSPLSIACLNGHESTVQLLLSNGAEVNLCDNDGFSPLYVACQNGHDNTVQLLLSNGADVNLCDKKGTSPLYIACLNEHESTLQLLLNNGAEVNSSEKERISPLCVACYIGLDSTVQLLLSNGAEVNLCDNDGFSPLYVACLNGHDNTVQLLLSNGAVVNLCDKKGTSPLYIACQNGHDSTVQLLLSNGADVNLCKNDGFSPLSIACLNGHDNTVQLLLSNEADVNLCNKNGFSPLSLACLNEHESTVHLLLSNGAEVNLCHKDGFSPLFAACQIGHDDIVKLLIDSGADINISVINGISPLYVAFAWRHYDTVKMLLELGADTSVLPGCGSNSLSVDCYKKEDKTIVFLLGRHNIIDDIYEADSFFSLFLYSQLEQIIRLSYL